MNAVFASNVPRRLGSESSRLCGDGVSARLGKPSTGELYRPWTARLARTKSREPVCRRELRDHGPVRPRPAGWKTTFSCSTAVPWNGKQFLCPRMYRSLLQTRPSAENSPAVNTTSAALHAKKAVRLLKPDLPDIRFLRDVSVEEFNRFADKLPEEVYKRARHVVEEIEEVRTGGAAAGGRKCPAVRRADEPVPRQFPRSLRSLVPRAGCDGERGPIPGRMLRSASDGAGFGGCTVNLVANESTEAFAQALAAGYEAQTQLRPEIYITRASNGAEVLK